LFLGPDQQALLGDLIAQGQEAQVPFDQPGTRALVTAIGSGPLAQAGALVFGDGIKAVFARFTARQDPRGMKLPGSTAAIGFAAFAAQQVEGALHHGIGALERAQRHGHGGVGAPKLLAKFGEIAAQSVSVILLLIQIASEKSRKLQKNHDLGPRPENQRVLRGFMRPLPPLSESQDS
jgi:hypothetical protein